MAEAAPDPTAIPLKSPDELAAQKFRENAVHPRGPNPEAITTLSDADPQGEFEKLEPGKKFIGKDKQVRVKPYIVKNDSDFDTVPEGALFVDPKGNTRTKPKYEGIDFTAQTLYDMAYTDSERKKALERSYPGKVKQDTTGEFYVDDDGVMRKPGRGITAATGFATAAAAPTAGAVTGGLLGGATGPTAIGGAVVGSMLGQGFNDAILHLSGVMDRTPEEELTNMGEGGAAALAGEGLGRGVASFVPAAKAGMSKVGSVLPGMARKFLGTAPEDLEMNLKLQEQGLRVPPSTTFKESPHIINVAERFYPGFYTQKEYLQSATEHMEKGGKKVLKDLGVEPEPFSLTKPTEAVPTQKTGETLMRRTLAESQQADQAFAQALEKQAAEAQSKAGGAVTQRETILKTAAEARDKAQALINDGYEDIRQSVKAATKISGAGGNSGELWGMVGQKLQALKKAIQDRHTLWYDQADKAAEGHLPNAEGLSATANDFLEGLPEGFEARYPSIVKKLRDLAGVRNEETGEWIKEPVKPTFGQLHNLRSDLRNNVQWYSIAPDIKNGIYKFFSSKVDSVLHDPNAGPELKVASQLLDATDKSYKANMEIFNDNRIGAVIKGLEGGEPADPKVLFDTIVKEGRTDLTKKVKDMVGPNLWAGVKAADMQEMLDSSKSLVPGQIDGRAFVKQVIDRHRGNMLELVHGKEASEMLLEQARKIEMLEGRLDIPVKPGDTMTMVIGRARQAAEEAKRAANQDPLAALNKEMRKIEAQKQNATAQTLRMRKDDPLKFMYDPTTGATEAVDRILNSEDLIRATAYRFGHNSPEFNMLRQVWAQRLLTGTLKPGERLAKVSPEIQQLMLPGVTLEDAHTLAKEMDFLMGAKVFQGGDTAGGMAVMSRVENPVGGKMIGGVTKAIPGVGTLGRAARGLYYKTITDFVSKNPALFHYLMRGLKGTPEEKQAAVQAISKVLQRGGAMGAGGAVATEQGGIQ